MRLVPLDSGGEPIDLLDPLFQARFRAGEPFRQLAYDGMLTPRRLADVRAGPQHRRVERRPVPLMAGPVSLVEAGILFLSERLGRRDDQTAQSQGGKRPSPASFAISSRRQRMKLWRAPFQ